VSRRVLKGDHCQCAVCGLHFNSTYAFDKHRAGEYGVNRHCLTADQMRAKGMSENSAGWWVSEASPRAQERSRDSAWARSTPGGPEALPRSATDLQTA